MDDLNVTLASKAEQQETLRIVRGSFLCCHPQLLALSLSRSLALSLSVFRSWLCRSDFLISLFCPLPRLSFSLSLTLFLPHIQNIYFSLMVPTNGREANSDVTLNAKWQAIAAVHFHQHVDANNKTQRLDFTMGDMGSLFSNQSITIDEQVGKGGRGHAYLLEHHALRWILSGIAIWVVCNEGMCMFTVACVTSRGNSWSQVRVTSIQKKFSKYSYWGGRQIRPCFISLVSRFRCKKVVILQQSKSFWFSPNSVTLNGSS